MLMLDFAGFHSEKCSVKKLQFKNIKIGTMTKRKSLQLSTILCACALVAFPFAGDAQAQSGLTKTPSLIITSDPLPESLRRQIYSKPVQVREITPTELVGKTYYAPTETLVTQKVSALNGNLYNLQNKVSSLAASLNSHQRENEQRAAAYYANVATINTQLQAGTTPSNPRLVSRLSEAETDLEALGTSVAQLNGLGVETAAIASEASFLLEETRAAYGLPGAVEEDHVKLAETEDSINNTLVVIERVLNTVNDDITRTSTYLSSERNNLRTLALGVTNGDLYGKSLANRPFSSNAQAFQASYSGDQPMAAQPAAVSQAPMGGALPGPRPLAKISFDKPDVAYEQPVYAAVNEALERYPNARFDLVAVHSTQGNAAQVAIESTKARRNAEKVLRSLTQMGLPLEKVDLSYSESGSITDNEVQLFVK